MTRALNAFTAVLIIACPCALLLAATFTHGNMLRILGLNGLYLRNAKVIERFAEADTLVFDKTGTITHGKSSDLEWHGEAMETLEREVVGFLAMQSAHPYSRLIASYWAPRQTYAVDGFKEVPGEGVEAIVDGLLIKIGSRAYVGGTEMSGVKGSVWVRVGHRVAGCFSVRQPYRDGISELAADLHVSHQIHLLSGDNDADKSRILALFGDDVVMNFRQSPEDKMAYIEHLQSNGRRVVMLGDGLNDAGALARSDVGIAVTDDLNRFSPACDIILDGSRLAWLKRFVEYARKGKTIVTAAFGVSLVYNVIGLSYAVSGLLSPVIAAIIMPLMSMSIVALSTLMGSVYARKLNLIVSAESKGGVP